MCVGITATWSWGRSGRTATCEVGAWSDASSTALDSQSETRTPNTSALHRPRLLQPRTGPDPALGWSQSSGSLPSPWSDLRSDRSWDLVRWKAVGLKAFGSLTNPTSDPGSKSSVSLPSAGSDPRSSGSLGSDRSSVLEVGSRSDLGRQWERTRMEPASTPTDLRRHGHRYSRLYRHHAATAISQILQTLTHESQLFHENECVDRSTTDWFSVGWLVGWWGFYNTNQVISRLRRVKRTLIYRFLIGR